MPHLGWGKEGKRVKLALLETLAKCLKAAFHSHAPHFLRPLGQFDSGSYNAFEFIPFLQI
jgi:hypothetical protein